jgi:hypothetical protein
MAVRATLLTFCILAFASPCFASVEISAGATKNMICSAGVCSPTAKKAVLNVNDLTNLLASGDAKVTTGAGAVTITVVEPFSWTSPSRLTLDANYNVSFRATVTVAGQGAVSITDNDGGTGGDLIFFPRAKLDFWDLSSSLVVNGVPYVLVNDLASLASVIANNQTADVAFARDYDAADDGTYTNGAVTTNFDGIFEGLGHSVSNFSATGAQRAYVGLFSRISEVFHDAILRDLRIQNANISGGADSTTGALAGMMPLGTIIGVSVSGTVVGGKTSDVGGLVGSDPYGNIIRSISTASVSAGAHSYVGGIAGGASSISYSYATGKVTSARRSLVGGLAGFVDGDGATGQKGVIAQSWSASDVLSSSGSVGGLLGGIGQYVEIRDTYALGDVSAGGSSSMGGFAGFTQAPTLQTSYSVGHVQYVSQPPGKGPSIGGFIGNVNGSYAQQGTTPDYWDLDTSGYASGCGNKCPGVKGITDAQLKSGLPASFDPKIWTQDPKINSGYPYLLANPPPQ